MKFDKELFIEALMDVLSSLPPIIWITFSCSIGLSVVKIFRNLFFDYSSSCNHVSIKDSEDYVDEEEREFEDRYNYDYSVNSVLDNNLDPIKSVK